MGKDRVPSIVVGNQKGISKQKFYSMKKNLQRESVNPKPGPRPLGL